MLFRSLSFGETQSTKSESGFHLAEVFNEGVMENNIWIYKNLNLKEIHIGKIEEGIQIF